jgi:adenine-specific DNA-methyltransferase
MQNLLDELKNLLATQPRFTQEGRMIKQAVIDAAQSLDAELLRLLISHDALKRHFFQDVDGVMVFDKVKLLRFVSNKAFLEDSYTAFKNKIGLATKNADGTYDAYLSDSKVLND